jgi:hypothetical protein
MSPDQWYGIALAVILLAGVLVGGLVACCFIARLR